MSEAEMAGITLPAGAEVRLELTVTSTINFTAHAARIRVNKMYFLRCPLILSPIRLTYEGPGAYADSLIELCLVSEIHQP